ncbi:hypothetical protein KR018_001265, partial [Drosophila ironensis]
ILCGFLMAMLFAFCCYSCHQFCSDRRKVQIQDLELPPHLMRSSVVPRGACISNTRLTHINNIPELY